MLSKIELAWIVLETPDVMLTPIPALKAMVLPSPGAVPPMRFDDASSSMRTPSTSLLNTTLPVRSVPMKLPCTELLCASLLSPRAELRCTPSSFPEMTLPAPAAGPPMVFQGASTRIPSTALPRSVTPSIAVPMKLPSIRFPDPCGPLG